jgi:hypothetical protein
VRRRAELERRVIEEGGDGPKGVGRSGRGRNTSEGMSQI